MDNTQLSEFQECPRRYKYKYIDKVKFPNGAEAAFSSWMVHAPLADWYKAGGNFEPDWLGYWKKYLAEIELPPSLLSVNVAKGMFQNYVELFKGDFDEFEIIEVEKFLPTEIENYGVKCDVVFRRKDNGSIYVVDHKVSKYEQTTVIFNRQFLGGCNAVGAVGYIVNRFQIGQKTWSREEYPVPPDLHDEWLQETYVDMEQVRFAVSLNVFPKRDKECHRFCFKSHKCCEGLAICEAGALKDSVLAARPKVEDPEKYLKGE